MSCEPELAALNKAQMEQVAANDASLNAQIDYNNTYFAAISSTALAVLAWLISQLGAAFLEGPAAILKVILRVGALLGAERVALMPLEKAARAYLNAQTAAETASSNLDAAEKAFEDCQRAHHGPF